MDDDSFGISKEFQKIQRVAILWIFVVLILGLGVLFVAAKFLKVI